MQYTLAYKKKDSINELVQRLKRDGFEIYHFLDDVYKIKEHIIGICIDLKDKVVFQLNTTCMAAWSGGKRRPLYVEEIIDNYDRLIIGKDFDYYKLLVNKYSNDTSRPIGGIYRPL